MKSYPRSKIDAALQKVVGIRNKYVETPRDEEVRTKLDLLLANRAMNASGIKPNNKMGLLVTGESGAGKSTLLERVFRHIPELQREGLPESDLPLCTVEIRTPISLKSLGLQTLRALEYYAGQNGSGTRADYFGDVRNQLELRRTKVLFYDEGQDPFELATKRDFDEFLRTLKGMMGNSRWPTVIVLSGGPELEAHIEADEMLLRRFYKAPLSSISMSMGGKGVANQLRAFCKDVGLECPEDVNDIVARAIHVARHQLGRTFEVLIDGITEALLADAQKIKIDHLADAYDRQTGCGTALNIFTAPNWQAIRPLHTSERRVPHVPSGETNRGQSRGDGPW